MKIDEVSIGMWCECTCPKRRCYTVLESPHKFGTWRVKIVKIMETMHNTSTMDWCAVYRNQLRILRPEEILEI